MPDYTEILIEELLTSGDASFNGFIAITSNEVMEGGVNVLSVPVADITTVTSGNPVKPIRTVRSSKLRNLEFWREPEPEEYRLDEEGNPIIPPTAPSPMTYPYLTEYWVKAGSIDNFSTEGLEEVDISELIPTPIYPQELDTSLRRLATIITSDESLAEKVRGGLRPRGEWNEFAFYRFNDTVSRDGTSYIYISETPGSEVIPVIGDVTGTWQVLAQRGETGVGTSGNDTPYGPVWDGQTDSPSRNSVYDALESYKGLVDATYAPLTNPSFDGNVEVPESNIDENAAQVGWVKDNFAPIVNPQLDGLASRVINPATSSNSTELATTNFVQQFRWRHVFYATFSGNTLTINDFTNLKLSPIINLSPVSYDATLDQINLNAAGIYMFEFYCSVNQTSGAATTIGNPTLNVEYANPAVTMGFSQNFPLNGWSAVSPQGSGIIRTDAPMNGNRIKFRQFGGFSSGVWAVPSGGRVNVFYQPFYSVV